MNRRPFVSPLGLGIHGGSGSLAQAVFNPSSVGGSGLLPLSTMSSSLDVQLRWFRFACYDVPRMMTFYLTVLKMHLDRQIDAGAKVRTCLQYPGDKVGLRFEYDTYGKGNPRGPTTTAATTGGVGGVGPLATNNKPSTAPLPTSPTSSVSLLIYVDSVDDYIGRCREAGFVVWIDAMTISEEPLIRSGVILDPSGLKIRLLESEIYQLNKQRSRGRLAYVSIPIKDYTSVEKCIKFYEDTFQTKGKSSVLGQMAMGNISSDAFKKTPNAAQVSPSPASTNSGATSWESGAPKKGVGFRLVDMERFVEELTTYVWLANGNRKKHTAVCLFHRVQRKTMQTPGQGSSSAANSNAGTNGSWNDLLTDDQQADEEDELLSDDEESAKEREQIQAQMALIDRKLETSEPEESKLFLGLSFAVPDIELAINFLKNVDLGTNNPPSGGAAVGAGANGAAASRLEIQHLPGFPRFISFLDPAFMNLEISDGAMGISSSLTTIQSTGHSILNQLNHHHHHHTMSGSGYGNATTAAAIRSKLEAVAAATAQQQSARATAAASALTSLHTPRPPSVPPPPLDNSDSDDDPSRGHEADEWSDGGGGGGGRSGTAMSGGSRQRSRTGGRRGALHLRRQSHDAGGDDSVSSDDNDDTESTGVGIGAHLLHASSADHSNLTSSLIRKVRRLSGHGRRSRSRTGSGKLTPSQSPKSNRSPNRSPSPPSGRQRTATRPATTGPKK